MKQKTNLFLIVICFILAGCNKQGGDNSDGSSELLVINFEQSFQTEQQMLISDIADSVEYIELKTPDNIVITRVWDIKQFDDNIIIKSRSDIYLFHKNGKFIRQIGSRGQGPGEYTGGAEIVVDRRRKEFIIADIEKFLYYDLNGNFLRRSKTRTKASISIGISDSILWIGEEIESANSKYKTVGISSQGEGDTVAYINNPLYKIINSDLLISSSSPIVLRFYYKDDYLFFKGDDAYDTIWKISGVHTEPYAFIDMGKYKMPVEYEPWHFVSGFQAYREHRHNYWSVPSLTEDDDYFFLLSRNRSDGKDNPIHKYIVYNKKKNQGFVAKDENGMGITDDMMGGPPIWPRWSSNDYYIGSITTQDLLEKIEVGDYTPTAPLKELLSRIDEYSNDLVILCRKKKQ